MNKIFPAIIFWIFYCLYGQVNGQPLADSVIQEYKNKNLNKEKYFIELFSYANSIIQNNPNAANRILDELYQDKDLKDYPEIEGKTCLYLAIANRLMGNMEVALNYNAKAIIIFEGHNLEHLMVNAHIENGTIYTKVGLYKRALAEYREAWALQRSMDDQNPILGDIYANMGFCFYYIDNISDSVIYYYQKAIDFYDIIDQDENKAVVLDNLGQFYVKAGLEHKAVGLFREAATINKKHQNNVNLVINMNNLALYYKSIHENDSALLLFQQVNEITKSANLQSSLAINYYNVANFYFDNGDIQLAKPEYLNSIALCCKLGLDYGLMLNYGHLARVFYMQGNTSKADSLWEKSEEIARKSGNFNFLMRLNFLKSEVFERSKFYRAALQSYKNAMTIKDSLKGLNNAEELSSLIRFYEMDIYNKELHRKQKIISQKNYTILAMTIGFVIFAILLVIIYLKKRQLKTKNQIIYNQITAINIPFDRQSKIDDENLSDEQKASKHIFIQLIDLVKNEKVYLDPQITRERIAQRIGTNENYISKALHDHSETNLSELLNRERVNEAIKHIKGNPYINNQELIQLCGFNSERSFYRIFKKTTGFTPTEFKNITKNQQQKANPGIELL